MTCYFDQWPRPDLNRRYRLERAKSGLAANGLTIEEIVTEYPQPTAADVQACLGYAARAVDERELPVRLTA